MKRQCCVPFCDKYTPRSKDRFCASHRNEFFIRKISPYKELPPLWAFRKCKHHQGWQRFEHFYYHKSSNSYDDFNNLLTQQNHQCAICRIKQSDQHFDIDHCHITGKVRGLLCRSCNMGLGYFKDSPSLLNQAADYLNCLV